MSNKGNILRDLKVIRGKMGVIVDSFKDVNSSDPTTKRKATNMVVNTMFDVVDSITKTEIEIYNYLRSLQK